jgi:hypothetical protein
MTHRKGNRWLLAISPLAVATMLVALGSGAAASTTALLPCQRDDYAVALRLWHTQRGIVAAVGIVTDDTPACTLTGTVRMTVRYRNGAIARLVRGNPAAWQLATTLEPWTHVVRTWSWRNWCYQARSFVLTASANGRQIPARISNPPRCRSRRLASDLVDSGPGTRLLPFTGDRIPAHMLPPGTPPPLSPALIRVTNGWVVSDGRTLVAVYAGEAENDPGVGLFAIVRQDLVFGLQTQDTVKVGRTGAVRITGAPSGGAVEKAAQRGDLAFSSATGARGVLHLARDTLDVTP